MRTIVTHIFVDLDAITAIWLVKKFLPSWGDSHIAFVPAGSTLDSKNPDSDPNILHVDTGLGKFDHHQSEEYTSATKLLFEYLLKEKHLPEKLLEPLKRLVILVNDIDHFGEVNFAEATSDHYELALYQLIYGLHATAGDDRQIVELVFPFLDASLRLFRTKINAEKDIKKGFIFQSRFGKSLALQTKNHEAIKLALKMGYHLVMSKDPETGHVRIKTLPKKEYDLTPVYKHILTLDKKGTWFLHISKNMLLNASSKNPNFVASSLSLQKLIDLIKTL